MICANVVSGKRGPGVGLGWAEPDRYLQAAVLGGVEPLHLGLPKVDLAVEEQHRQVAHRLHVLVVVLARHHLLHSAGHKASLINGNELIKKKRKIDTTMSGQQSRKTPVRRKSSFMASSSTWA
jgi:hypothetical protein